MNKVENYQGTKDTYRIYFDKFKQRISTICQKQQYRVYLKDCAGKKLYEKFIQQRDLLKVQIQKQKELNNSSNKNIINQISKLSKLKDQYARIKQKCSDSIQSNEQIINKKHQQEKYVESKIKQQWRNMAKSIQSQQSQISTIQRLPSIYNYMQQRKKQQSVYEVNFVKKKQKKIKQHLQEQKQKLTLLKLFNLYLKKIASNNPIHHDTYYKIIAHFDHIIEMKSLFLEQIGNISKN